MKFVRQQPNYPVLCTYRLGMTIAEELCWRAIKMLTQDKSEQVLWMADCYSLAKHFHDPHKWMSLLEPTDASGSPRQPLHYWLWMEIWKAAQNDPDIHSKYGTA